MTTQDEFAQKIDAINADTNQLSEALTSISDQLAALREQITGMGLTAAQESEILEALDKAAGNVDVQAAHAEEIAAGEAGS